MRLGCPHFPTDICSMIQEGEVTVEKCAHQDVQRIESATRCHLNKTNMDITTVHRLADYQKQNGKWNFHCPNKEQQQNFHKILCYFPFNAKLTQVYNYTLLSED